MSFHWEVIKETSLGLSGDDDLLKERLLNELTTAYGKNIAAPFFIGKLKNVVSYPFNREYNDKKKEQSRYCNARNESCYWR